MQILTVDLGERSYPIYIGQQCLHDPAYFQPHIRGKKVLIVTNTTVAPLYLAQCQRALEKFQVSTCILPDGETYKNLQELNQIFIGLLQNHCDRQSTLIALGGGVVGDMTGFAAAVYQRGVDFIQVPTTLLAQVDSSVGGKTGVNHTLGKNMIGAFHQPRCVIADTDTLSTLDERQYKSGLAEVIKYGLIQDEAFFVWLETHMDALLARDSTVVAEAIFRSCHNKAMVVARDEREEGARALLNLGHTFGHAIESATGYSQWLHGEAVATGMMMAALMSHKMGWLSIATVFRIRAILVRAGLPLFPPESMDLEQFYTYMQVDKKVVDGQIRLILLEKIGQAVVCAQYDAQLLKQTLSESLARTWA